MGLNPEVRLIVLVGFMGAFTTFSTYIFETGSLLRESQWVSFSVIFLVQNVAGLVGMFGGLFTGQAI